MGILWPFSSQERVIHFPWNLYLLIASVVQWLELLARIWETKVLIINLPQKLCWVTFG